MIIHVRLFARARDLAQTDQIDAQLAEGATVADLRRRLAADYPALAELLKRSAIAVDNDFADDSHVLPANAEVALLPPVSGGQARQTDPSTACTRLSPSAVRGRTQHTVLRRKRMARTKNGGNGRVDRLEEGMAALSQAQANLAQAQANLVQAQAALALNQTAMMQNQTALAQQHTAFLARMAEIDARMAENNARTNARMAETDRINSERFARIEAILREHSRILMALPDAIRDKIGFKAPTPPAAE